MRRLDDFLGEWTLDRDIFQADGTRGRFRGTAHWTPEGDGALYEERGLLELPGQGAFTAERRYRWDAALNVFFEDGRFFHTVPSEGGETDHWCDPDDYRVRYDFAAWPDWSCTWTVRGSRKDYWMTSRYRRAAA